MIDEQSVYVFRASTRRTALRRFLELALQDDREYENSEGKRVRWALASLETFDELTEGRLKDGEVFSRWTDIRPPDASKRLDTRFSPEKSELVSSGVSFLTEIREGKRRRDTKANIRRAKR